MQPRTQLTGAEKPSVSTLLLVALLLVLGGLGYFSVTSVLSAFDAVNQYDDLAREAKEAQSEVLRQTGLITSYVLYSKEQDFADLEVSSRRFTMMVEHLIKTVPLETTRDELRAISSEHQTYLSIIKDIKAHQQSGNRSEAIRLLESEGIPVANHMTQATEQMLDGLQGNTRERYIVAVANATRIQVLYLIGSLITVITGFMLEITNAAGYTLSSHIPASRAARIVFGGRKPESPKRTIGGDSGEPPASSSDLEAALPDTECLPHAATPVDQTATTVDETATAADRERQDRRPPERLVSPSWAEQKLLKQVTEVMDRHGIPRYIWLPILRRESGLNPTAWNQVGKDSRGLFQINIRNHPKLAGLNLFDPLINAETAAREFLVPAWARARNLTDPADQVEYVWHHGWHPHWPTAIALGAVAALRRDATAIAAGEPVPQTDAEEAPPTSTWNAAGALNRSRNGAGFPWLSALFASHTKE